MALFTIKYRREYKHLSKLQFRLVKHIDGDKSVVQCLAHPRFTIAGREFKTTKQVFPKNCLTGAQYTIDNDMLVPIVNVG